MRTTTVRPIWLTLLLVLSILLPFIGLIPLAYLISQVKTDPVMTGMAGWVKFAGVVQAAYLVMALIIWFFFVPVKGLIS